VGPFKHRVLRSQVEDGGFDLQIRRLSVKKIAKAFKDM
jgi:hypothetical protein